MVEYVKKDDFDRFADKTDSKMGEHSEKLAQCKLDQHIKDHDTLTKMGERQMSITEEIKSVSAIQKDISEQIQETAGNLNLLASKVANISKGECFRRKVYVAIGIGVAIAIMGGVIMYWLTKAFDNMSNPRDKELEQKMDYIIGEFQKMEKKDDK